MASDKTSTTEKAKRGRRPKTDGRLEVNVQTLLQKDEYQQLSDMAESSGRTISSLLREAVLDYLKKSSHRSGGGSSKK
jgi:hypothetical protein